MEFMRDIDIKVIPYSQMRYSTVGDYWHDDQGTHIRIADLGNSKYNFLVAVHELIECFLLTIAGIKEEDVRAFDEAFEKDETKDDQAEPGDDPKSPYRWQHFVAESFERLLAVVLMVDWQEYDKAVRSVK